MCIYTCVHYIHVIPVPLCHMLQVHHDLAKYHEIARFALDGDEALIDWESALFHEEHAANLGVAEAITTMAKIYLRLPHDVLVSCTVPVSS